MMPSVIQAVRECANMNCQNKPGEGTFALVSWPRCSVVRVDRVGAMTKPITFSLCGRCKEDLLDVLALIEPVK
jgi:hypothetical protein